MKEGLMGVYCVVEFHNEWATPARTWRGEASDGGDCRIFAGSSGARLEFSPGILRRPTLEELAAIMPPLRNAWGYHRALPPLPPTLTTTEAVPLLLALAREHPQLETRSAMAACLFNLIKKPSAEQVCLRGRRGGAWGVNKQGPTASSAHPCLWSCRASVPPTSTHQAPSHACPSSTRA